MDYPGNRRQHVRYERNDRLFVQILSSSETVDIANRTIFCHNCDVSMSGMKIELDNEIAINSQIDLWAAFDGLDDKFYLRGNVCWCYEMGGENGGYQIGVELEDAFATDYTKWLETLRALSPEIEGSLPGS